MEQLLYTVQNIFLQITHLCRAHWLLLTLSFHSSYLFRPLGVWI